ncbi:MAG: hypothetical protein ACTSVY_13010 [Candidatus Helarchaeota archaeon]
MPLFGIFNIGTSIFLLAAVILVLKVSKDHWNDNRYSAISGIISAIAIAASAIFLLIRAIPVFYWSINATTQAETEMAFLQSTLQPIPFPFSNFAFYFICFLMSFLMVYWIYELKTEKWKDAKEEKLDVDSLDIEVSRKLFHICIIGIIVCYLFVGQLVSDAVYQTVFDLFNTYFSGSQAYYLSPITLNVRLAGQGVCAFVMIVVFQLIIFTDLIRIYKFRFYPMKELAFVYRNKERSVLGPHVYLLAGTLFAVLLFPGPIAISVVAISGFGDAMATIVGVSVGKRKLKPLGKYESSKTWEGCLGGIVGSFVFGLISYVFVANIWYADIGVNLGWILLSGVVLNGIGTLVFFIGDYFTPPMKISDNIYNPFVIPIVQFLFALLLFPWMII